MTYGFMHESVWHPPLSFAEVAPLVLPSELELQSLWFAGAMGREFVAEDGRAVRVVQFGEWNRSAGPDFTGAVVEVGGERLAGPIELDPEGADWERHGHAGNPLYERVVLHVVFRRSAVDSFTRAGGNRQVARVVIPQWLLNDALHRPPRVTALAHPGRCLQPLRGMPDASVRGLLAEAAEWRAAEKASRWLQAADVQGRDAALFFATAETLGY